MERMIVERHQWQTIVAYDVPSASRPGHTWRVELVANPAGAHASCECPAGQYGRRCRHADLVERLELGGDE